MAKIKVPPVVLVEWNDAVAEGDPWPSTEDVKALFPETVGAVGWLIERDKHQIKLAMQWNENGAGGVWTIPRGMVRKIWNLKHPTEMRAIFDGTAIRRPQ